MGPLGYLIMVMAINANTMKIAQKSQPGTSARFSSHQRVANLSLEPLRRRRDRPPRRAYDLGREDAVIRNEANAIGRCTLPLAQIR